MLTLDDAIEQLETQAEQDFCRRQYGSASEKEQLVAWLQELTKWRTGCRCPSCGSEQKVLVELSGSDTR